MLIENLSLLLRQLVCLVVTIHLRLNGYAPKQTLEFLKNIRYTDEQKKTSKLQYETCFRLLTNPPENGGFVSNLKAAKNAAFDIAMAIDAQIV